MTDEQLDPEFEDRKYGSDEMELLIGFVQYVGYGAIGLLLMMATISYFAK
jgi:hypothetical protein